MLEVALAIAVLVIGFGAIASSLVASTSLGQSNREERIALEAAQNLVERLKGEPFETVFAQYNDTDADDVGPGPAPGKDFPAGTLRAQPGDPDGMCAEILFPGDGVSLREDVVDAELGMPRDLDFDGDVDGANHSDDYLLLPVRVRVAWIGENGLGQIDVTTTLTPIQ